MRKALGLFGSTVFYTWVVLLLLPTADVAAQQCPNGQCWDPNGTTAIVNHNTGVVAIGAAPLAANSFKLDLSTGITFQSPRFLRQIQTWGGGFAPQAAFWLDAELTGQTLGLQDGFGPGILFRAKGTDQAANTFKTMGRLGAVRDLDNDDSKMVFRIVENGVEQTRLVISNDPVLGVHAVGVPLTATYADLAEWVTTRGSVEPGTVVAIHEGSVNEVTPSRRAYDTSVAGVVSARPGIVLGEAGDGKATIATTGRVKVKVDASKSPIKVGDLLVTSDREGFAMRSEAVEIAGIRMHRPGTLIGKALEPLEAGQGEILILLSLQ